ncbi:hypothetical protein C8Q74DRAFT_1374310 [Fomes fomentarius]|nr:hypothetical protein C8Q74DRAFT_1374310 [Fomes fomentarius]
MQGYVTSSVVGGRDGYIFNDVFAMNHNGDFLVDNYEKHVLDKQHPIRSIYVSYGWVVDGIAVEYQNSKGESVTLSHGSQFPDRKEVKFHANEILVGVFGRAGKQGFYKRELPYGPPSNAPNRDDGEAFYVSDVLAFGGFSKHTSNLGISGLFFFKDLSRPMDIGRYHILPIDAAVEAAEKNVGKEEVTPVENGNGDLKGVVKGVEELAVVDA